MVAEATLPTSTSYQGLGPPAKPAAWRRRRTAQALTMLALTAALLTVVNFAARPPLLSADRLRARYGGSDAAPAPPPPEPSPLARQLRARQQQQQRQWRRPEDRRIAFLHKAADPVTLRGIQAALLAKRQVEAAGGWYGFVYSLYPHPLPNGDGEPESERQRITLDSLRAALGNDTVVPIGWDQVVGALGRKVMDDYRALLTDKMGQSNWAWSTNDVVDVTWHLTHGAALPAWATHVWAVELDVAWTGDIVDALMSTVSAPEADWVGYETVRSASPRDWFWHDCRNWAPAGGVWKSMRHAARYSRRLLAAISDHARARRVQCDEITAPSVCRAAPGWCVVDDGWRRGHPACGVDPINGEDLYRWDSLISPERWDLILAADAADAAADAAARGLPANTTVAGGRLYHRVKW